MNNSIENLYKNTSNESSPVTLDKLILNHAKLSCQLKNTESKRWLYSLATAAVLVMGFSMIINLQNIDREMQVAPQAIKLERKVEIEFMPESGVLLEPHHKQTFKKQNAPAKLKISNPESMGINDFKKAPKEPIQPIQGFAKQEADNSLLLESISLPTIPAPAAINVKELRDEAPLAKIINDDIDSSNKNTINTMATTIKEKEVIDVANSTNADATKEQLAEEQNNYYQQKDKEIDKVVVTGSRILREKSKDQNKPKEIKELDKLIQKKHFAKAKILLKLLKIKYSNTDFSEYERLIEAVN